MDEYVSSVYADSRMFLNKPSGLERLVSLMVNLVAERHPILTWL